jgi:hypothetical protein
MRFPRDEITDDVGPDRLNSSNSTATNAALAAADGSRDDRGGRRKGPLAVGRLGSRRAATSDTMSRYPAAHSSNGVESNHGFVDDFTDEAGIALTHNNVASNPSNGD